jgi:hypothetical protein
VLGLKLTLQESRFDGFKVLICLVIVLNTVPFNAMKSYVKLTSAVLAGFIIFKIASEKLELLTPDPGYASVIMLLLLVTQT